MTKYFRLMTMVLLLVLPVSAGASFWPATGLTGGVANQDLDEIDGALLGEGHVSMTIVDGFVYFHYLDATSGAGESSPDIISPDSNAGTKRWELVEVVAFGFDARDENITNVGNLALDSLSSDDGTDIVVTLGADAGDDFNIDSGGFVYEGDANTTTIGSLIATTADINAGTMDNTVIGGGTAVAGSFAAVVATSLSNTEGNITNVSDIALDSISSDASTTITITLGNDAGDDLVVNSNTLNVSGDTDNLGFGSAASADYFITSSPTWTSTGSGTESAVIQIGGTMTGANGDTAYLTGIEFLTTHTTQGAAEAIGVVSQVRITEPNITIGTATVTESATLHIVSAASEATRDYSLFVDAGDARFDGNVMIGETVPDEMLHITSSTSAKPVAKIENTNADALSGSIGFYKIATGSAADDDVLGRVDFNALDSGDNATLFGAIIVESSDVTDAAESGVIRLAPMVNGTARDLFNAGGEDTNASDPVEVV
ncbi:MAG: hypothetical protein KAT70_07840, partial [Thermoplasmata archaeon]|nr:hypothetical protein [Thermoplasmata archaeon]